MQNLHSMRHEAAEAAAAAATALRIKARPGQGDRHAVSSMHPQYTCVRESVCACARVRWRLKARTSVRTGMVSRQRHTHCSPWTERKLPRLSSPCRRKWTRLTACLSARKRKPVRIPMLA